MEKKEGYDNYSQLSKAGSSAFTLSAVQSVIIIKTFIQYTVKKKNPDRSSLPCVTKEKQSERNTEIFGKNCLITGFDISDIKRKPCVQSMCGRKRKNGGGDLLESFVFGFGHNCVHSFSGQ